MEPGKAQDDDLVISLVELALARPPAEREACLRAACGDDDGLFRQVWSYVEAEERMQGFLREPLYTLLDPDPVFKPGDLLEGRFRIIREVAQGGMGIVYEAADEKLQRRIAIKCAKPGFRQRLPPEVRHASEISHPNVCKIFEIHTATTPAGETDFITMEFLEGETLAERLDRERLAPGEARVIARQLAAGLAEAHRNQVVHGDLKSNNIILARMPDGSLRAVITDFGLAQRPPAGAGGSLSGIQLGTPAYMAPELWRGEDPSAASDVYALGVILFELAAGRKPYGPEVSPEERSARRPPPVDARWDRVIARCLDPNPARRFAAGADVAQALAPSNTRRWLLAGAAAAVLALATGLVTYERASAPKESWRLAMLPIEPDAGTREPAERLSRETANQLARLKGGTVARLAVLPLRSNPAPGATHVLRGSLAAKNGNLLLRAVLTDMRSRLDGKEWVAEYAPAQMRYAPLALAGMVTSQLGLPPLAAAAGVNAAAAGDYRDGLQYLRRNSGVDRALALLERATAEDPDSPLTFAALAEARQWKWFLTNDRSWLERAGESERQAQERNPDLAPVHRVAGLLALREGLYDAAESECLRAVVLDPNDGEAYRVLGQAYEAGNHSGEALVAYGKAVEVDPSDYRNQQQLGRYHYRRADYANALPYFLKMVDLAPDEAVPHYTLGSTYFSLGRLSEAESELRLAIRLGETADELHNLGIVLIEERKYPEAVASILRALSLAPEQSIWRMNLGTAYRLMNRKPESEQAYRRALELAGQEMARDPRDGRTRSHLAFICARLGDASRAESEIRQAEVLAPDDAQVRFMAVATFEALRRREDSIKLLSAFSYAELADVNRWPDMADLSQDPRFIKLLAAAKPR
jgi:Flp pilus assembly protein TadD